MSATRTRFGRWIEAINQMNNLAFGGCNITQYAHELGTGQVVYFATPKSLHPLHGQIFKEQLIILVGQLMRQRSTELTPKS